MIVKSSRTFVSSSTILVAPAAGGPTPRSCVRGRGAPSCRGASSLAPGGRSAPPPPAASSHSDIFSCRHFIFILHYLPHLALAEAELAVHVAVEWRGGRVVLHHRGRNVPLFQIEYHTVMVRVTSVWCDGATSAWRCAPWSGRGNTPSEERTRLGDTSGECPQTGPLPPGNIGIK